MNELACIQTFVAIVENGSQLNAAKKLNQTSAAINKKLSKLEGKLGVQLLERDNKASALTPIGERYYHAYTDILDKLKETEQIAKQSKAKPSGRLMITMSQTIAENFIIPKLKSFIRKYPDIFLVFDIADKPSDYLPGKQDIYITSSEVSHENLVRKKIGTARDVVCASQKYLQNQTIPKKPSDLHELHYIGHCMRAPLNLIHFDHNRSIEINKPYIRTNDEQTAIQIALKDLGFIYIKEYQVKSHLKNKSLVELLAKYNTRTSNTTMCYHYQHYLDPKIKVFVDYFS